MHPRNYEIKESCVNNPLDGLLLLLHAKQNVTFGQSGVWCQSTEKGQRIIRFGDL